MSVPSRAPSGRHLVRLSHASEKHGSKDRVELHFLVENPGGWENDALADDLRKRYPQALVLQNGLAVKDLGLESYAGIGETFLFSTHPVGDRNSDFVNYGGADYVEIGHYAYTQRALLRFDLSAVPKDARLAKAFVKLYLFKAGAGRGGKVAGLAAYEVLKEWKAGRGISLYQKPQVLDGEASWLCHAHPAKWAQPGCGAPGQDRGAEPVGKADKPDFTKGWVTLELSTDLVQRWIADPASNRGVLIQGDPETNGTSSQYRSSEFADPAFRPRVVLAFEKLK